MQPPYIRLFSTDLDGTMVGDPGATDRFVEAWESLDRGVRPLLVYNTSRSVGDTRALMTSAGLPEPDYIIACLGTEMYSTLYDHTSEFRGQFGSSWDPAIIDQIIIPTPGVRPQPQEFQTAYKSSWFWDNATRANVDDLERRLRAAGIEANVIYSCRHFLDIVPARAGKGAALAWLCARLHISMNQVLVAGDTANDSTMFLVPGVRGIVVGNALPELMVKLNKSRMYFAQSSMAHGVVEGLLHFGVLAKTSGSLDHGSGLSLSPG